MLIRHANSVSNEAGMKLHKECETQKDGLPLSKWLEVYAEKSFLDSRLSNYGIEQCLTASKYAKTINFQTIFVSPLRRTIETAYWIFKDHPNFSNIKFILKP
jgi:broad specificity phosphatase PhoE